MILAIRGLNQSLVVKRTMCHYGVVPQDCVQMEMQNLGVLKISLEELGNIVKFAWCLAMQISHLMQNLLQYLLIFM